jgi:TRAP-type transport system periplasmic protein
MVALLVMVALVLGSCSSPSPTPTPSAKPAAPATTTAPAPATSAAPAPATSAAPAPATSAAPTTAAPKPSTSASSAAGAPIIIRLAPTTSPPPPAMGLTLTATEFARILESKSNNKVKFEIYFSETLAKGTELVSAVQNNIANAAFLRSFAEPGKIPLATISELPGISSDMWALLSAYTDLMNQEPLLGELSKYNMKPISSVMIMEQQLICRVPIRSMADLQGKKVAGSGIAADVLKGLGATVVNVAPPEQYEALLRGTVDAICAPQDAIQAFKFYEAGKYFIANVAISPRVHPVVLNTDTWKSLPPDVQKAFVDAVPELIKSAYETITIQTGGAAMKAMLDNKVEMINFNDADLAKVQAARAAYADKWAADTDAKNLPGKKILADYRALAAKYEPLSPYKKK